MSKITRQACCSQVLINFTIFANFTFLVSVLLCHNLDSSMLKCESSSTLLKTFSLKGIVCRNNYMKDTTLRYTIFQPFHPPYAKLNLCPYISSYFKKFDLFPLVNKQTFLVQTMAFQAKLTSHYVFQSHTIWLWYFPKCQLS